MTVISKKEIDFYNTNGYLVVENVIDSARCDYYLNLFLDYAKKIGNNELKEIPQIHREVAETLELMKDKKVVSIIEAILGGESVGLQSVSGFKKAGTPSSDLAWNPHQDGTYIDIEKDKYVSGDIVLDDHLPDSGILYVYPGSHLEELLPFEPHTSFNFENDENPGNKVINIPEKYEKVPLYLKKGSLLSFHSNLIHGSYANTSKNNWRPLLLMAYMRMGEEFNPGKTSKRVPIKLK
jgi:ectoine hydroxylase-related dioxygenase (phytanoyl-CoA dioxygenase family)